MGPSDPNSNGTILPPHTSEHAPESAPRARAALRVEHSRTPGAVADKALGPHPWRKALLIAGGLFCFTLLSSSLTPRPSTASHTLPGFHPIDLVPEPAREPDAPASGAKFRAGGQAPEAAPAREAEPRLNRHPVDLESDAETVRAVFHAEQAHGVPLGCLTGADFLSFIHAGSAGGGFDTTRWSALGRADGLWAVRGATIDDFYRATGLDPRTLHADTYHDGCCGEH